MISNACHWHAFSPSLRTLWELTQLLPKQRLLELIANGRSTAPAGTTAANIPNQTQVCQGTSIAPLAITTSPRAINASPIAVEVRAAHPSRRSIRQRCVQYSTDCWWKSRTISAHWQAPDICAAKLVLYDRYLLVEDNGRCGGVNVSFGGLYVRAESK